ncbi:MAG: haloacid dehalogenase [SAR202 cluster bacterium]|nr:haloacid dehalogenase [SAR202 cluster bacterium]
MPSRYSGDLTALSLQVIDQLTARHQAREQALAVSREVIRHSANAIRAVHRGEYNEARRLLDLAGERLKATIPMRQDNPEIYYAGFSTDARKEYSEAHITLALISGAAMPSPEALGVDPPSFLNGLAEVIGELRRHILDSLRRDSFERCEEFMDVMDETYGILVTIDFPEAVTGGLRSRTDNMRAVLERTRSDLTLALQQRKLELRLAEWQGSQSGPS